MVQLYHVSGLCRSVLAVLMQTVEKPGKTDTNGSRAFLRGRLLEELVPQFFDLRFRHAQFLRDVPER